MIDEKYLLKKEHFILDEFKFKNGRVLKDVNVEYATVGTPKYDENGNIINAILFFHGFEGNYSSISEFNQLIGQEGILTKDDYFFIPITSLGFPNSCCPSTTELNYEFPDYEIEDLVRFKKQFLSERFPDIEKVHGIIGYTFGGYEALAWSIFYPDDVDFVINLSTSFKTSGYKYIFSKIVNQIIESSPNYFSNQYDESISKILISISQLHYFTSFTEDYFNNISTNEIDLMIENFIESGLFYDIYDIQFRNDFLISYDIQDKLDQIKCKVLIIAVNNTSYYTLEHDFLPLKEHIKNSELVHLDVKGKTATLEYLYKIKDEIKEFIDSV